MSRRVSQVAFVAYILLITFLASPAHSAGYDLALDEASGVTARNDTLFFVGDDNPGRYFALPVTDTSVRVMAIDPAQLQEIALPGCELALDLEAIDFLADGRLAVLSEDLTAMIGQLSHTGDHCGVIARYYPTLNEFGNMGIEGLAVRATPDGSSEIAVLWEGGYPNLRLVPYLLATSVTRRAFQPILKIHTLGPDSTAGWIDREPVYKLKAPKPQGREPNAMRYRAADLVWHSWSENGETVDGFIILIAASNSPERDSPTHKTGELQRFRADGVPVGDPIDLHQEAKRLLVALTDDDLDRYAQPLRDHMTQVRDIFKDPVGLNANFEGLGWFVPGERLVLVYDGYPLEPTLVFFVDVPPEWR